MPPCAIGRRALPDTDVPPLRATTGLRWDTALAMRAKRTGSPNDSRYSSTTLVASSSAHRRSRSLPLTSALLPIDTNDEMPAPRRSASAAMAIPTPPDWEAMAMPPGRKRWLVYVALRPHAVDTTPSELGPTRRMPWRRAAASTCSCMAAPATPASANPAVTTTALRHSGGAALLDGLGHCRGRHGDDGEVGDASSSSSLRRGEASSTLGVRRRSPRRRTRREGGRGSVVPGDVVVVLGADDDDVPRVEDRLERADGALPVAQVGVVLQRGPPRSDRAGRGRRRPRTSGGGRARHRGRPAACRRCRAASGRPGGGTRLRGRCRRDPRAARVAMPS